MPSGVCAVAAQLEHEHAAVAVERDLRGIFDEGLGQHRLHPVAGREQQALGLLRWRQGAHRRLRREIRTRVRGILGVRRGAGSWPTVRRLDGFPRRGLP